jgi:hypothetical protein
VDGCTKETLVGNVRSLLYSSSSDLPLPECVWRELRAAVSGSDGRRQRQL